MRTFHVAGARSLDLAPHLARALLLLAICLVTLGISGDLYETELGRHTLTTSIRWATASQAHVTAQMTIPATRRQVWAVLTDYEHLDEFIPLLDHSEVTRRQADSFELLQRGGIRLPFFKRSLDVTFRVREVPHEAILFEAVAGDFRVYRGSWSLKAVPEGTHVIYTTAIEPAFPIPRWVMLHLERWILKATFRAILHRCR